MRNVTQAVFLLVSVRVIAVFNIALILSSVHWQTGILWQQQPLMHWLPHDIIPEDEAIGRSAVLCFLVSAQDVTFTVNTTIAVSGLRTYLRVEVNRYGYR